MAVSQSFQSHYQSAFSVSSRTNVTQSLAPLFRSWFRVFFSVVDDCQVQTGWLSCFLLGIAPRHVLFSLLKHSSVHSAPLCPQRCRKDHQCLQPCRGERPEWQRRPLPSPHHCRLRIHSSLFSCRNDLHIHWLFDILLWSFNSLESREDLSALDGCNTLPEAADNVVAITTWSQTAPVCYTGLGQGWKLNCHWALDGRQTLTSGE